MTALTGRLELHQWVALIISVSACATDVTTRRIPNLITLGGLVAGLVWAGVEHGASGLGISLLGGVTGLLVFLPLYLLGGLGAGDVKLMACLGAWTGPGPAVWTALYGAIAGGVMAVVIALASGYFRAALRNLGDLLMHFRVAGVRPHPVLTLERSKGPRLPYALPITAGAIATMWLH